MHSPPVEWALGIGHLVALDYLRDRGEPDNDTLTECLRELLRTDTPEGRAVTAVCVALGGYVFYRHLIKPEMRGA